MGGYPIRRAMLRFGPVLGVSRLIFVPMRGVPGNADDILNPRQRTSN